MLVACSMLLVVTKNYFVLFLNVVQFFKNQHLHLLYVVSHKKRHFADGKEVSCKVQKNQNEILLAFHRFRHFCVTNFPFFVQRILSSWALKSSAARWGLISSIIFRWHELRIAILFLNTCAYTYSKKQENQVEELKISDFVENSQKFIMNKNLNIFGLFLSTTTKKGIFQIPSQSSKQKKIFL